MKYEKKFHKVLFNYCSKFFLQVFLSILEKVKKKKRFPIVFSNLSRKGVFFQAR